MSDMKPNLKINLIMSMAYKVLTLFVPLITTPYLSRVLGAEGIGIYSYEYSIAYYFMLFIQLGLENYGNRTIAEISGDENERSRRFAEIFCVQGLNSIIFIAIYVGYVVLFSQNKLMGWIMLGFVISSALDITWFYYGMELISATVIRNLIVKIITIVLIFTLVKTPNDLFVYALIMALGTLISQAYLWAMLYKNIHFCRINFSEAKKHIKPLVILFIPVIAVSLYRVMDKIMLGSMASKIEVGYYESAERVVQLPIQVINAFGIVMMPRIANLLSVGKEGEARQYLNATMKLMMLLCAFMSFGIMGVAKEFVPLFYGEGYDKCVTLFYILLPSSWFLAFSNVIRTQYLIPRKRDKLFTVSIFSGAIVNIVLNSILISKLGSSGAAIGTLCAEATVCIVQVIGVKKELPVYRYILICIVCLATGFAMFVVVYNIHFNYSNIVSLILKVLIGIGIAVLPTFLALKSIQKDLK